MAALQTLIANPFALMMSPEDVLKAVEGSERLSGLTRRVCRPLDKPTLGQATGPERASADERDGDD